MVKSKIILTAQFLAIAFVLTVSATNFCFLMNSKNPRVVLLYTQKEPIPDSVFRLSSVPLAIATYAKFGQATFATRPATAVNIRQTLNEAEFVIIGTHGWDGLLVSDEKIGIGPSEIQNLKMRNIYFGSCFFGARRSDWQAAFVNAKVIGHDSETYQLTGWIYLVFISSLDLFRTDFH